MQHKESKQSCPPRSRHCLGVLVLLVGASTLSGCFNPDWRALQQARLLWEANGVYSYSYDLQISCFCIDDVTRPVRVLVQGDETVSVEYIDGSKEDAPAEFFENYDTIDDLFDIVETGINGGAATVNAEYDGAFGYPANVFIDESLQIADEEIGWTVENLVPLRNSP